MSLSDWRYEFAFGFVIIFIFLLAAAASTNDPLHCNNSYQDGSSAPADQKPTSVVGAPTQKPDCRSYSGQRDNECQSFRQAEAAEDQACIARWQFGAGIIFGLLGTLGLGLTVLFTKDAAQGALDAAKAAHWSADTAGKTLDAMEATAQRQLRAYVTLFDGGMVCNLDKRIITGLAVLKNSGQTPGLRVLTWRRLVISNIDDAPFMREHPVFSSGIEPQSIIGPQSDLRIEAEIGYSLADLAAIRIGEKALFFWGAVEYDDIFGKERRYFIFNCRVFGADAMLTDKTGNQVRGWALVPHPAGYSAN